MVQEAAVEVIGLALSGLSVLDWHDGAVFGLDPDVAVLYRLVLRRQLKARLQRLIRNLGVHILNRRRGLRLSPVLWRRLARIPPRSVLLLSRVLVHLKVSLSHWSHTPVVFLSKPHLRERVRGLVHLDLDHADSVSHLDLPQILVHGRHELHALADVHEFSHLIARSN